MSANTPLWHSVLSLGDSLEEGQPKQVQSVEKRCVRHVSLGGSGSGDFGFVNLGDVAVALFPKS
jgi:hypothetical protein